MPQTPPFKGQLNTGGYNNNLYDESKEEVYPGLYYHDNNLASGSLEALIHHLVPTVDYYPDVSAMFCLIYFETLLLLDQSCCFHFLCFLSCIAFLFSHQAMKV